MLRRWAVLVALITIGAALVRVSGQTPESPAPARPASTATPHSATGAQPPVSNKAAGQTAGSPADATTGADDTPPVTQQPQIIVNPTPPPAASWDWHDRVAWGAGVVLAVLGYVGIMLALRTLRNIDRHLVSSAATAQAALESASAALALAEAIANSERPWIVVTIEPFLTVENSFKVMASNRGRSPARIVSSVDQVKVEVDETRLAKIPEFEPKNPGEEPEPIVLLPGEATGIWAFNRADLPTICKDPETLKLVERWRETLFLFGRIKYLDLNAPEGKQNHETYWCCRYIHGEKSSALVMAGPPEYNKHT